MHSHGIARAARAMSDLATTNRSAAAPSAAREALLTLKARIGKSVLTDTELLSLDRIIAEIDAVEASALSDLAGVLLRPEKLSAAGIGPNEERFLTAVERIHPGLPEQAAA